MENIILEGNYEEKVNAIDTGKGFCVVLHRSLQEIANRHGFSVRYFIPAVFVGEDKATIYHCMVTDNATGRTVTGIGESCLKSLYTSIDKVYPAETAANRAFDRAMIQILGFQRKVYSITELPKEVWSGETKLETIYSKEELAGMAEEEIKPETAKAPANDESAPAAEDTCKYPPLPDGIPDIIQFGTFKGKSYEAVKRTASFEKLVAWVKRHNPEYEDETIQRQIEFIKSLP